MAQDGHQDTTASDERSFVPPTTLTFLGPAKNESDDDNRGSRIASPVGMDGHEGKDVVPNAAIQRGDGSAGGGKADSGTSEGKHLATVKVIGCSSLRGGGGELGTNKNLDLWLQLVCTKLKLKHAI